MVYFEHVECIFSLFFFLRFDFEGGSLILIEVSVHGFCFLVQFMVPPYLRMKKIRSKMKALEHNIIHEYFKCLRADNSGVSTGICRKFELIQAFMHVLVTCKNEDDSIKNEWARVVTTFFPL